AMLLGKPANSGRQAEHLEVRNVLGNDAECERDVSALLERVDAEPRQILVLVRDIEVAGLLEGLEALGRALPDDLDQGIHVPVHEDRGVLERAERASAPQERRDADLQVDVAGAEFNGASEQGIEL